MPYTVYMPVHLPYTVYTPVHLHTADGSTIDAEGGSLTVRFEHYNTFGPKGRE